MKKDLTQKLNHYEVLSIDSNSSRDVIKK